jgi:hypothetical protein
MKDNFINSVIAALLLFCTCITLAPAAQARHMGYYARPVPFCVRPLPLAVRVCEQLVPIVVVIGYDMYGDPIRRVRYVTPQQRCLYEANQCYNGYAW